MDPSRDRCAHGNSGLSSRSGPRDAILEPDRKYDLCVLFGASGTLNWGPNRCKNDEDGAVDPDERLRIADRGLREGILSHMMRDDGVGPHRRSRW